jgi:hypothetical protein
MVEGDELQEDERVQLAEQVVQEHDPLALRIQPPLLDALLAQGRVMGVMGVTGAIRAMLAVAVCYAGVVVGRVCAGHAAAAATAAALAGARGLGPMVHCAARQRDAQLLRSSRRDKEEEELPAAVGRPS